MSIWHTPGIESGHIAGRFSVEPRRDRIAADGSLIKTKGLVISVPKNGILNTEKLAPMEVNDAQKLYGDEWPAALDKWLDANARQIGLAKGLPGRPEGVTDEQAAEKTKEYLKKTGVVVGARSAGSVA